MASSHHRQKQVISSSTQQCSLCFCLKGLKLVHPAGHVDDDDRPSPALGAAWTAGAGQWLRGSQWGSGDSFRQLMLKTDLTLIHIYNPCCAQGKNQWACSSARSNKPFELPFLSRDTHLHQNILLMVAVMGIGRGLGGGKRPDLPWLCHPGMVYSRWLRLHRPAGMTLPCHSSLRSVKAIGDEAWLLL